MREVEMNKVARLTPRREGGGSADARGKRSHTSNAGDRGADERVRERLLDAGTAAEMLGLAVGTLRNMTWRGDLSYVKIGKRCVRYRESELLAWIDKHTICARR
jgi:excisionase family DNA binding protein